MLWVQIAKVNHELLLPRKQVIKVDMFDFHDIFCWIFEAFMILLTGHEKFLKLESFLNSAC